VAKGAAVGVSQAGHVLLLDHNADVNARRTDNGATPLYIAACNGHAEVVKLLLDLKADVHASLPGYGYTALYVAAIQK